MAANSARPVAYLSAREAARRLGVSDKTVRTWVRSGRVPGEESARGFRIPADAVDQLAAERSADFPAEVRDVRATSPHTDDQVADLRAHVADLRDQVLTKDRQISELHTLLAQAQRALPTPSERPFSGPTDGLGPEPTQTSAASRNGRPWWRFWHA
jgi:excisionase family DNA binding protein